MPRYIARQEDDNESASSSSNTLSSPAQFRKIRKHNTQKERRFEEIASEDDDDGGMTAILQSQDHFTKTRRKSGPRIPRPSEAYHEEAGDDGFIFSVAKPSAPNPIEQASDPREPPQAQSVRPLDSQRSPFDPRMPSQSIALSNAKGHRITSGSGKAKRRVSALRDGAPAYPHPMISDSDLHRHCSTDFDTQDRLRYMAMWALERGMKPTLEGQRRAHGHMMSYVHTAMSRTLEELNAGSLNLNWETRPTLKQGPSQKAHPRNEVNRRTAATLERAISAMQRELDSWERVTEELNESEEEVHKLRPSDDAVVCTVTSNSLGIKGYAIDATQKSQLSDIQRAFASDFPWLSESASDSARHAAQSSVRHLYGAEALSTTFDGQQRRKGRSSTDISRSNGPHAVHQGSHLDPRWSQVELRADLLYSRTHNLTQLSQLAERYLTSISARGAQAISDMLSGASPESTTMSGASSSKSSHPSIPRESRANLDRILSGIRRLEAGQELQQDSTSNPATGDVSDGDILRAFAGLSNR